MKTFLINKEQTYCPFPRLSMCMFIQASEIVFLIKNYKIQELYIFTLPINFLSNVVLYFELAGAGN